MKLVIYNNQNGTEIYTIEHVDGIGVINRCEQVKTEVAFCGETRSAMYLSGAPNFILSNTKNIVFSDSPEYSIMDYKVTWTNPELVKAEG